MDFAFYLEKMESKQNRYKWLPSWQQKIIHKYPALYLQPPDNLTADDFRLSAVLDNDYCSLRFGFECQEGWRNLLEDLSATGTALIQALSSFGFQDAEIRVAIVKQKFGVMVWADANNLLPPFRSLWFGYQALISRRSAITCERSGEYGELRDFGGWVITLSEGEYKKELIRRGRKSRDGRGTTNAD